MRLYENGKSCPKCYRTGHDNCETNGDVLCLGDIVNCTELNGEITSILFGATIPLLGKVVSADRFDLKGKSFRRGSYTFTFKDLQCSEANGALSSLRPGFHPGEEGPRATDPANHLTGSFHFDFGDERILDFKSQLCNETDPDCSLDIVGDNMRLYENGKSCPKCFRTGHDNCETNGDVLCLGDIVNCTELNGEITSILFGCVSRSVCDLKGKSFRRGSYRSHLKTFNVLKPMGLFHLATPGFHPGEEGPRATENPDRPEHHQDGFLCAFHLHHLPPSCGTICSKSCVDAANHLTGSFHFNFGDERILDFRSQLCNETDPNCSLDIEGDNMRLYENGKSCPKCYRTGHDNCETNGDVLCLGDIVNCTELNGEITNILSGATIPFAGKGCVSRSVSTLKGSPSVGVTFTFKDLQCSEANGALSSLRRLAFTLEKKDLGP
ncbi:hypothetical protein E2320_000668, partial [Naja naja]